MRPGHSMSWTCSREFLHRPEGQKNQPWVQRQHNPHPTLLRWRAGLKEAQSHCTSWHKFFILATDQSFYLRVGESIWCLSLTNLDDVDSLATSTGLGSRLLWCALAQTLRAGRSQLPQSVGAQLQESFPLIFSKYAQLQIPFTCCGREMTRKHANLLYHCIS